MAYSILDILDSLIDIENKAITIFEELSAMSKADERLRVVSNIFILEEKRHVENYEELKKSLKAQDFPDIDLNTYSEISTFFNEFYRNLKPISAKTVKELLMYAYRLELHNSTLLSNILNLFASFKMNKVYKQCHDVISELIEEERKHVSNISMFLKLDM